MTAFKNSSYKQLQTVFFFQELISLGASRLLEKAGDSISTWTKEVITERSLIYGGEGVKDSTIVSSLTKDQQYDAKKLHSTLLYLVMYSTLRVQIRIR